MHDPDQEHTAGAEPPERIPETTPPMPGHAPQVGADWEVIAGPAGPDRERRPGASLRELWQRRSTGARVVTAAATVAVLAAGGTVAYAATSGNSGNDAVPAAGGSASATPSPGDRPGRGMWFGLGGEAVHGEATVKDRDTDKWVVQVWQRGTVEKVDGDQVTVKSDDGTSWTWTVGSDTTVYRDGAKGSGADDLKKGETAYLVGTRSDDDTRTAKFAMAGTWEKKGPGDWRGGFPGHGHRGWGDDHAPSPSASPSGSDKAA